MSEFHIRVVRMPAPVPHPNADKLDIFYLGGEGGYPAISEKGLYKEGDLAVYIPVDSIVPANDPRFSWLGDHLRIKAMRLRGIFSMGILTPADPGWVEGQDVREDLAITKFEPIEEREESCEKDPGFLPTYTDLEGLRRWPGKLTEGEEVVLTEKIHGENMRVGHNGERLYVGSRTRIKKNLPGSAWWNAARNTGLEEKCKAITEGNGGSPIVLYGESHGYTGKFPYGTKPGKPAFRAFDAFNSVTGKFMDYDDFLALMKKHDIPVATELYRGPWKDKLKDDENGPADNLRHFADGTSTLDGSHIREGFVVRPVKERWDPELGRVILKLHGEAFLLKNK